MVIFTILQLDTVSIEFVIKKLLIPIIRLMLLISIGLVIGQVIEAFGWTKKMAALARPLFKFSNLGKRCAAAFIAAFLSGVIANSMLVDFFKEKKISKMQLFLTNYLNQLPAFFLHLPTTIFIVIPLTGFAGLIYFALTFSATLLRFVLFLIVGRIYFSFKPDTSIDNFSNEETQKHLKEHKYKASSNINLSTMLKQKLLPRMVSIYIWMVPIYTFVFMLNSYELFDYLNTIVSNTISTNILPVQSISVVVISFAAEFTSGFAAAGALMDAGVITIKETVLALLLGNIIAFPIRALRHQIPRYLGIFSPKIGLFLLLSGQSFRILSLIFVGTIYYMVA